MKKILSIALLSLFIFACNSNNTEKVENTQQAVVESQAEKVENTQPSTEGSTEGTQAEKETIKFRSEDASKNLTLEISSNDDFETCSLNYNLDGQSEDVALKRAVSGSGIRLATDDEQYEVHFKSGEGGIAVIKGVTYNIEEVK